MLKLELLEDRTAEEIAAIWSQHFVAKVRVVDKTILVKVNVVPVPVPMVPNYYRNIYLPKSLYQTKHNSKSWASEVPLGDFNVKIRP